MFRFNAVRPAFHIRRLRNSRRSSPKWCFNAVRPAFHIRSRGKVAAETDSERRFNAVRPAFHIRRTATTAVSVTCVWTFQCRASGVSHSEGADESRRRSGVCPVSMPCVRRFTFGVRYCNLLTGEVEWGFNAVRPAFHIRRWKPADAK